MQKAKHLVSLIENLQILVLDNTYPNVGICINKAGLFNLPLGDQQKLLTFYEKRKYFDPPQRDVQSKTSL